MLNCRCLLAKKIKAHIINDKIQLISATIFDRNVTNKISEFNLINTLKSVPNYRWTNFTPFQLLTNSKYSEFPKVQLHRISQLPPKLLSKTSPRFLPFPRGLATFAISLFQGSLIPTFYHRCQLKSTPMTNKLIVSS